MKKQEGFEMEEIHGEITFHVVGDTAKIININGFPSREQIWDLLGINFYNELVGSGTSFDYLPFYDPPFISFNKKPREFVYLRLWSKVSIEQMKEIQSFVHEANDHFNELLKKWVEKTEDVKSEHDVQGEER
jgi:hypothetical protein